MANDDLFEKGLLVKQLPTVDIQKYGK